MFKDEYHPQVKKDIRRIDKQVQKDIRDIHIPAILKSPFSACKLTGNLAGIYSYHFTKNNVQYRICYTIDEKEKTVHILMIRPRENIYNILRKRIS